MDTALSDSCCFFKPVILVHLFVLCRWQNLYHILPFWTLRIQEQFAGPELSSHLQPKSTQHKAKGRAKFAFTLLDPGVTMCTKYSCSDLYWFQMVPRIWNHSWESTQCRGSLTTSSFLWPQCWQPRWGVVLSLYTSSIAPEHLCCIGATLHGWDMPALWLGSSSRSVHTAVENLAIPLQKHIMPDSYLH